MAKLSRDDVLKLAQLARLELSNEEADNLGKELSDILRYVEQLKEVDTNGLAETTQVSGLKNVMREDQLVDYGVSSEDLLRLAPRSQDGQIKVNRMIG